MLNHESELCKNANFSINDCKIMKIKLSPGRGLHNQKGGQIKVDY